jgi:cyclopropane fatty-acyl-phospholipid synthase-like methyltransferase
MIRAGHPLIPEMKRMKLYDQVERIYNDLKARGVAPDAPLAVSDLTPFDQYHYHGTYAVDAAISALGLGATSRVLDVGSGLGGPARYVAATAGSEVTAVELQGDLHAVAEGFTRRCHLEDRVRHIHGDILDGVPFGAPFDAVMSYLVFLHIPDRRALFAVCRAALRAGGGIFIEDITKLKEPSASEWNRLEGKLLCPYLPTLEEYAADLRGAGFKQIEIEDMSRSWTEFTAERLNSWKAARERNIAVHGEAVVEGLTDFYATVAELYDAGTLGGARIHARRLTA